MGMLISLAVAFIFTPWSTNKALAKIDLSKYHGGHGEDGQQAGSLFYEGNVAICRQAEGAGIDGICCRSSCC